MQHATVSARIAESVVGVGRLNPLSSLKRPLAVLNFNPLGGGRRNPPSLYVVCCMFYHSCNSGFIVGNRDKASLRDCKIC